MHFTSILGKSNRRHFGSNGSHVCANLRILGCTPKIILGTQKLQWCREGELNSKDPLILRNLLKNKAAKNAENCGNQFFGYIIGTQVSRRPSITPISGS